jgi:hypothetical protein
MWFSSKVAPPARLWAGMALIALSALLSGCMSDAHEGDLPWSPTATWEGTPALPGGMMNP